MSFFTLAFWITTTISSTLGWCTYFPGQSGVSAHEGGEANSSPLDFLFSKSQYFYFYFRIVLPLKRKERLGQTPKKSKRIFWIPKIKFPVQTRRRISRCLEIAFLLWQEFHAWSHRFSKDLNKINQIRIKSQSDGWRKKILWKHFNTNYSPYFPFPTSRHSKVI